jgi:hypothetical protein
MTWQDSNASDMYAWTLQFLRLRQRTRKHDSQRAKIMEGHGLQEARAEAIQHMHDTMG